MEDAEVTRLSWLREGIRQARIERASVCGQAFPIIKYSADQESHLLLLFDMNGLKQFEIERRLRSQGDVAIAGESCTTGTRRCTDQSTDGSALAAACDRPDTSSSGSATAHSFRLFYDSPRASTLRNGDLSIDFDGRFDGR